MGWPISIGPWARGSSESGVCDPGRAVIVAQTAGSGKARKARAGRWPRRRGRRALDCECAVGEPCGSATMLASSKERAANVMSVRVCGSRRGGPRSTWRSRKPEEGSGRGRGLTAELSIRDSAWRNASKSGCLAGGSRFVGERALH